MTDQITSPSGKSVPVPTIEEAFLADRMRFWSFFTRFTTYAIAVVLLVVLFVIYLMLD